MRIGVDVDGVLAECVPAINRVLIETSGKDLFGDDVTNPMFPPVWDYPLVYGYTAEEFAATWKVIGKDAWFWHDLNPLPEASEVCQQLWALRADMQKDVDVYFITTRFGVRAKWQTEEWLRRHGFECPTVILTGSPEEKADMVDRLRIDAFIDDRLRNVNRVAGAVRSAELPTRVYLKDAPYNQDGVPGNDEVEVDPLVKRVRGVRDMLVAEGLS